MTFRSLRSYCNKFFVTKDQGAYVGCTATREDGVLVRAIYYFTGCNPQIDEEWYDNARYKFGGDDFGEHLPIEWLQKAMDINAKRVVLSVTNSGISMKYFG